MVPVLPCRLSVRQGMPHKQLLDTLLEGQTADAFMQTLYSLQPLEFWTHMSDAVG